MKSRSLKLAVDVELSDELLSPKEESDDYGGKSLIDGTLLFLWDPQCRLFLAKEDAPYGGDGLIRFFSTGFSSLAPSVSRYVDIFLDASRQRGEDSCSSARHYSYSRRSEIYKNNTFPAILKSFTSIVSFATAATNQ